MIPFNIKFEPGIPIYEQLIYAVKKAIVSGQLNTGDRFPSVRTLSLELKINPNTVQKAVARLVNEKLLEVRPGIGCMVAAARDATEEQRREIISVEIEHLVVEAKQLRLGEREIINAVQQHWKNLK